MVEVQWFPFTVIKVKKLKRPRSKSRKELRRTIVCGIDKKITSCYFNELASLPKLVVYRQSFNPFIGSDHVDTGKKTGIFIFLLSAWKSSPMSTSIFQNIYNATRKKSKIMSLSVNNPIPSFQILASIEMYLCMRLCAPFDALPITEFLFFFR